MSGNEMVGDNFRLGYRFQSYWDVSMASAFFCGELGGGLFLVSMLVGSTAGMVLGLLITGIGKSFFHLRHMGVPRRSWRAIARPDRSWISRGLIAIVLLCSSGVLVVADSIAGGILPSALRATLATLAGAAALIVMSYQGFAMAQSSAIALWNTAAMPLASLVYALLSGVTVVLALPASLPGGTPDDGVALARVAVALLAAVAVTLMSLLYTVNRGSPAGRLSVALLTRTRFAAVFHGLVVTAGIALPLAALWVGDGPAARAVAALGVLAGFFVFRVLVFKAGVYQPVLSFGRRPYR